MTQADWTTLLSPIITALIYVLASLIGLAITGLLGKLKAYLDARGDAQASAVVADASVRVQAAMQNAAGQIALLIQAGKLNPTDITSIKAFALDLAGQIEKKVPDALATLKPAPGSVAEGIVGKVTSALPAPATSQPTVVSAPAPTGDLSSGSFQARAAIVVARLMRDLGLTREQASGIVGNLGQESGLQAINEIKPVAGRGGFGWAQWTGPRRVAFEQWATAHGLSVTDPEANYGFLLEELRGPEKAALDALRQTTTLEDATRVFEEKFERAGVVSMDNRLKYAQLAIAA